MKKLNILIADDHNLVLQGFILMIRSFPFIESVSGVNNGNEVLHFLKKQLPDLILMDLNMPEMDGLDTSRIVLRNYPDIKIIVLSGFNDDGVVLQAIELGVHGYMLKDTQPNELKIAIENVMKNGFYFGDQVVRIMRREIIGDSKKTRIALNSGLNEREKNMLKLLCQEKTTKEIAEEFFLSDRTVEKIKKNLAQKLEVKGTVGLVKYAIRNGFDL